MTKASDEGAAARFLAFARGCGALRFGEFRTRSGRLSPYFFDAGRFADGGKLRTLGHFYRAAIARERLEFDMIFGPAYKGIPLACALACACAEGGRDVPFAFNRKEEKDHGEGGGIIGAPLAGRVLMIDDVITAGGSLAESAKLIAAAGATPIAALVALDRMERRGDAPVGVIAIADLDDLQAHLRAGGEDAQQRAIANYRKHYGA